MAAGHQWREGLLTQREGRPNPGNKLSKRKTLALCVRCHSKSVVPANVIQKMLDLRVILNIVYPCRPLTRTDKQACILQSIFIAPSSHRPWAWHGITPMDDCAGQPGRCTQAGQGLSGDPGRGWANPHLYPPNPQCRSPRGAGFRPPRACVRSRVPAGSQLGANLGGNGDPALGGSGSPHRRVWNLILCFTKSAPINDFFPSALCWVQDVALRKPK